MALEFIRIVVFVFVPVILVFIVPVPDPADDLELQAQRSGRGLDSAHVDGTHQHEHQHIDKRKLVRVAWRVRIDQHLHVGRPLEQLNAADMLNAALAQGGNFTRAS